MPTEAPPGGRDMALLEAACPAGPEPLCTSVVSLAHPDTGLQCLYILRSTA